MTAQPDLAWLEGLLESQYGFAPTVDLRERLASMWTRHAPLGNGADARINRLRQVVENVVIGETYFFREPAQIEYVVRRLHAEGSSEPTPTHPVRILSAGCASGEEAYSLAIAISALGEAIARRVTIVGVDVSAAAIRKARGATYSAWSLRATPPHVREACFHARGDMYELDKRLRTRVWFEERNLFEVDADFWAPGAFDIIFCRNVGIYFSPRAWGDLVARFHHVLAPSGLLFLGHSETLRGISHDFDLVHQGNVFYYRRGPSNEHTERPRRLDIPPFRIEDDAPRIPCPTETRLDGSSPSSPSDLSAITIPTRVAVETGRSSTRVDKYPNLAKRHWILSLIETERFDEALMALAEMPPEPRHTLYEAVIALARGAFDDVERDCHALISAGHCQPEAHCLLGSCREHQRAYDSAERHYREATRIDARFGMAHLRLGSLLHRTGDIHAGQTVLEEAERILEHEDPERIMLFGGGFSRTVLRDLCRERRGAPKV